jgi:hypothetical protein
LFINRGHRPPAIPGTVLLRHGQGDIPFPRVQYCDPHRSLRPVRGGGSVAVVRGDLVTKDACRPLLDDPRSGTRDSGPTGAFRGHMVLLQALDALTHQVGGDRAM